MVAATPQQPRLSNYSNPMTADVLAADPDVVLLQQSEIPVELQSDLILQDIGGTELIKIIRHDMVTGQNVVYQPIRNIKALAVEFNPNTILGFVPTLRGYKESFAIPLDEMILQTPDEPIYVDGTSIVVQLEGLGESDIIELAISYPGTRTLFDA